MRGDDARSALAASRFGDVEWVERTGSTNADLLAAARRGAPDGLVLVADFQDAGRGRLDRSWYAPPASSLLCSVLLRPSLEARRIGLVTMALGVAAVDACEAVAGVATALKWPNDLVVEDEAGVRKLGGMLAETVAAGERVEALVVGIGINVNWPDDLPPDLEGVAVALNHLAGRETDRTALLVELLRAFERGYHALERTADDSTLRARYLECSATIGRSVRVDTATGSIEGVATGIDDDGSLVLTGEEGPIRVRAGDVTLLRPAGD